MPEQADLFGRVEGGTPSRRVHAPAPAMGGRQQATLAFTDGDAVARQPPAASERQASFAADISRGLGIPLPLGTDAASVGGYIERHRQAYEDACRRRGPRHRRG